MTHPQKERVKKFALTLGSNSRNSPKINKNPINLNAMNFES